MNKPLSDMISHSKTTLNHYRRKKSMSKLTKRQYVKKLQECTNVDQATTILNALKAGPAVRKLVETGVMLRNHPDPIQRQYGSSFIQAAIQEEEEDEKKNNNNTKEQVPPTEQPTPHHGEDAEEPIKEELLAGGNPAGTEGSEQSTDNVEPYPQVGSEAPNSDIESMTSASGENQMKENMGGEWPGMIPGIEPTVANEMGNHMGNLPQMNTPQMMKQMHYTVTEAMKRYVIPLRNVIKAQQEAIKVLSRRVQESEARTGSMKLDIASVRQHAMAKPHNMQETVPGFPSVYPTIVGTGDPRKFNLDTARAEINQLDKELRKNPAPYQ